MLLSIARSPGEKASASVSVSASASAISSRRLEPLRWLEQAGQPLEEGRPVGRGSGACSRRGTGTRSLFRLFRSGFWRRRLPASPAVLWICRSSSSGRFPFLLRVGIGNGKPRKRCAVRRFHLFRPRRRPRDHGREDAESHGSRDAQYGAPAACLPVPPRAPPSRRQARCRRASAAACPPISTGNAGKDSTLVGLSLPRHSALSVLIWASSVKTTLSSRSAAACRARSRQARCRPPSRPGRQASASAGHAPASTRTSIVDLGRTV